MNSENHGELSTERLQTELLRLTEHLEAFQHSPARRAQLSREIGLLAFELRYRNNLVVGHCVHA